jgi:hypothetical protein
MEMTFGKISEDERRRALAGERIDHHLTEFEASQVWSVDEMHDYNKNSTPRSLSLLYEWRRDNELSKFYVSIIRPYPNIPKDGIDCICTKD